MDSSFVTTMMILVLAALAAVPLLIKVGRALEEKRTRDRRVIRKVVAHSR